MNPAALCLVVPCEARTAGTDPAILAGIQESPRSWYVNVHTPTYPGGEVRGQLK